MLPELNDYDWEAAFSWASNECLHGTTSCGLPTAVPPGSIVDTSAFRREDVKRIVAISNGENDERDWLGVFELNDGRFAMVSAGCDYTGWG